MYRGYSICTIMATTSKVPDPCEGHLAHSASPKPTGQSQKSPSYIRIWYWHKTHGYWRPTVTGFFFYLRLYAKLLPRHIWYQYNPLCYNCFIIQAQFIYEWIVRRFPYAADVYKRPPEHTLHSHCTVLQSRCEGTNLCLSWKTQG